MHVLPRWAKGGGDPVDVGGPGSKMYFIVSGTVAYFSGYSEKMPKLVPANQWMCEPVLWHLG